MPRGRKKIRRNPGKTRNMYFNDETQSAILDYQDCECSVEREKIYKEKICNAFEQLAESLIFVYGFKTSSGDFESMKSDCVTFLYETIFKWDHTNKKRRPYKTKLFVSPRPYPTTNSYAKGL